MRSSEEVIVVMCSASEAVKETVDFLNANGRKVGLVQIHLYRPFSVEHFAAAIPASCKKIAVLDRSKETGSVGEPVYLDVVTALNQAGRKDITVVGGRSYPARRYPLAAEGGFLRRRRPFDGR